MSGFLLFATATSLFYALSYLWLHAYARRRKVLLGEFTNFLFTNKIILTISAIGLSLFSLLIFLAALWFIGQRSTPGDFTYFISHYLSSITLLQCFLGAVFGFLFSNWAHYIIREDKLQNSHLLRLHNRWGFVLLSLVFFGLFLEQLPLLFNRLASVSTPFASITLDESADTNRQTAITPTASSLPPNPLSAQLEGLYLLTSMPANIDDDVKYIIDFYQENTRMGHAQHRRFFSWLFNPFAACLDAFAKEFFDVKMIGKYVEGPIDDLRLAVRGSSVSVRDWQKWSPAPEGKFVEDLDHTYGKLDKLYDTVQIQRDRMYDYLIKSAVDLTKTDCTNSDSISYFTNHNPDATEEEIIKYEEQINSTRMLTIRSFDNKMPYTSMLLAYLLYVSGNVEGALNEIDQWIARNRQDTSKKMKWYTHRANIAKFLIMKSKYDPMILSRQLLKISQSFEEIITNQIGLSVNQLTDDCMTHTKEIRTIIFRYLNYRNTFAYNAAITRMPEWQSLAEEKSRKNLDIDLNCFEFDNPQYDDRYYRLQFLDTYGFVLMQYAQNREMLTVEDKKIVRQDYLDARNAFEQALFLINPLVKEERAARHSLTSFKDELLHGQPMHSVERLVQAHYSQAKSFLTQ